MVYCEKCGYVPVPESELPIVLPDVESYEPTDNGESPLAKIDSFVNTKCPKCGADAKRETDTMPQWAGSSWYYLRYCDSHNDKEIASADSLKYWMNVDWYNGGMEHTTLHLLYSRFWHKFLYDIGVVNTKEPYQKRTSHGMLLGEDGQKMSKSRGNVVNPDDIINEFGADTLRLYEMFIGDFEKAAPWNTSSIKGCKRFLDKVYGLKDLIVDKDSYNLDSSMHKTIKKVTEDINSLKNNTAIASLMTLVNDFYNNKGVTKAEFKTLIILLNPFAPHLTEELWQEAGFEKTLSESATWPEYDESKCKEEEITMPVQINGKIREKILISPEASEDEVFEAVLNSEKIKTMLEGKEIVKKIFVKGKIINIVIK